MSTQVLLTLFVPPTIEEAVVDWLLEIESASGFSSVPARGHSSNHQGLSLLEQVSGRKQQIRFEIHLPEPDAHRLINQLRTDFQNAGLHYWVVPLLEWGSI
ncbi:MAG: DUF3240 family protein [Methylococcaceae bacterium]